MSRNRGKLDQQLYTTSRERVVNDRQHQEYSARSNDSQQSRNNKSKSEQKSNNRNIAQHHQNPFQDDTIEIQRNFRRLRIKSEEQDFDQISNLNMETQNSNSIQEVKRNLDNSVQISDQSIKKDIPISPTSQNNQIQQRQQKRKKIQKYESESVDEEEFQNYFTNPIKRMEFDMQRKRQQMKELASINAFSLGNFGIKDIKALKEALPKIEEIEVSPVQEKPKNYATVSLCCLSVTNPFRNKIIQFVIYNKWFDRFILLVIVTNCMFLAMDKGVDFVTNNNNTIDLVFLCIYTTEMSLKIIAMGFVMREYSYLREGWNIMDFFVVVLGWVSIIVSSDSISGIKVIRILRPLRTINQIPNMSSLVLTIVQSLPIVFDVGVLFFFALLVFGTIACQLLGGHFQSRCTAFNEFGNSTIYIGDNALEYLCQKQKDCDLQLPNQNTTCTYYGNPVQGTYSFDNILVSIMNIFIAITLEGWSTMMYYVRQSEQTYLYDWFFVTAVVIGNFIVLNLMVAVQASFLDQAFDEEEARIKDFEEKREAKRQAKLQQELEEIKQAELEEEEQRKNNKNQENDSDADFRRRSTVKPKKKCCKNPCKNFKCPSWASKFSALTLKFTQTKLFDRFIIFLILLNTVVLASEFYNMPDWVDKTLSNCNIAFMILFTFEMVLKMIGYGHKDYFKDAFNLFDCVIVIMSYVDYFTPGNTPAIKMLRAFRLMRIFKLLRNWGSLRKLIGAVAESLTAIRNLGILIILYLFIGALLCKQFLGDYTLINEMGLPSRNSFASTTSALITMFILLTGDSWNDLISQTIFTVGNFYVSILIIGLLVIGNLFLLNLFLGILLRSIQEPEGGEEEEANEPDKADDKNNEQNGDSQQKEEIQHSSDKKQEEEKDVSEKQHDVSELNSSNSNVEEEFQYIKNKLMALASFNIESKQDNSLRFDQSIKLQSPQLNKSIEDSKSKSEIDEQDTQTNKKEENKKEEEKKRCTCCDKLMNYSLFILSPENQLRQFLQMFVSNGQFSGFIYTIIGLNSILLMLDIPALTDQYQTSTIEFLINVVSGLFIAEACLKILVSGFYFGENTYLKDPWNILDFVIVFFSVLTWLLEAFLGTSISFIRSFRALRALRPLRVVSTNEGMKTVVDALFHSIPALSNVLLIVLLFVLVFAILGIMLLVGQMGSCNNPDPLISNITQCVGNYSIDNFDNFGIYVDSSEVPMVWKVADTNYDNIFISMLTFYEIASTEAWPVRLWAAVDAVGYDQSPQKNYNQIMSLLFVFYIFFVTFFIMNLFVSVIVDKFNEEIKKRQGSDNFSHQQQEWVKIQRLLVHTNPKIIPVEPINCFRLQCFRIVQSQFFEYVVMAAITLNTLFLSLDYYGKSDEMATALYQSNVFFCIFFTLELLLKMLAYGFNYYWYVNWNKFDMVIVFSSLLTLDDSWLVELSFNVTALRIIRVARLLRMIKTSEGIRQLLKTLFMSIMNIANTGALLVLIFFTFSVVGMSLFSEQEYGNNYNDDANFKSFYISMMLVFRIATGDSWNDLMHNAYDQYGFIALIYHLTFNVLVQVIFLQVFIAVIGESFNENNATEDEGDILALKKRDIKAFQNTWAKYNPMGELYMKTMRLSDFLRELPPPLGYQGIRIEESKLNKIIYCLNIRDHQGRVYYPEVMWAIFHSIAGMNDDKVLCCEQIQNVLKLVRLKFKDLGKKISLDTLCGNKYYSKDLTAIKYIQAMKILQKWRNFKNNQINQRDKEEQKRLKLSILEEERKFEGSNDNNNQSPRNFKSPRSHNKSLPDFEDISESADLTFPMSERKGGYQH